MALFRDNPNIVSASSTSSHAPDVGMACSYASLPKPLASIRDSEGLTPLHDAACYFQQRMLEELLQIDTVDIDAQDNKGQTPLHYAIRKANLKAINSLLDKGANVHAVDDEGCTPLHFAARWNLRRGIKLLLERGADIRVVDNKGRTTLHYAADQYSTEAVEVLLEGGADVYAIDNEGHAPLHLAQSRGYGEVVNLLQQIAIQGPNSNMNNVNVKNLYGPGMSRNY